MILQVSYRMGEKGSVKILYSEKESNVNLEDVSPDVRGFLSLDSLSTSLNGLSLSQQQQQQQQQSNPGYSGQQQQQHSGGAVSPLSGPLSPGLPSPGSAPSYPGPCQQPAPAPQLNNFPPRQQPVVYTAATFAQTKFGSTKLKTNSKKPNRMSPTEFSNYIKQRAIQKQQQQQQNNCQYQHQSNSNNSGFYDKYYSGNYPGCNSNNPNINYNNFPKSPGSGSSLSNNDFGFNNFGSSINNSSLGYTNHSSNDYSSLLSDFSSDFDLDTNTFLQDILSTAGVGGGGQGRQTVSTSPGGGISGGGLCDDWGRVGNSGLGYNSFNDSLLGPESRSSSTKSMSSGSESLPSPPNQSSEGFINPRVLVAN